MQGYLKAKVSRAQLLAATGAGLALAMLPGAAARAAGPGTISFPFYPQTPGRYEAEQIRDILNLLETFEMFLVTTGTNGVTSIAWTEPWLSAKQAMLAIGQYHIDYLESLGAHPLLTTFTPRNKPNASNPIGSREGDAAFFIAAYMTAVREFAELGQPILAKNAFQAGATWAEIRGVVRALAAATGSAAAYTPSLNKAFETDHFLYTRDLYKFYVQGTQFQNSGVSLSGLRLTYPGRAAVLAAAGPMASALIQKTPNNAIVSTTGADAIAKGNAALTGERGDTP
jgi:hypothetical protein